MKKEALGFGTDIGLLGLPSAAGYAFGRSQPMTEALAKREVDRNYGILGGLLIPGYTGYHFGTRHAAAARLRELEDRDRAAQMAAQKEAMDKYEKQASTAYMRYLHGLAPSEQIPTMMGVLQRATGHGYHSLQDARQWPQGTLRDLARKANRQNIRKALRSPVDPLAGRLPGRFIPDLSEFAEKISSTGAWQRSEGKNPEGGLNAKGRASLKAQGHDIKPGVKGPADTPQKLKRKGSFLSRMFGPGAPGSMKADNGEPSRRALSAKAWGEAVPSDDAGRARLYAKGQALLKRYEGAKEASFKLRDMLKMDRLAAQPRPHNPLLPKHLQFLASEPEVAQKWLDRQAFVAPKPILPQSKMAALNAVLQAYGLEKDAFSFSDKTGARRHDVKTVLAPYGLRR